MKLFKLQWHKGQKINENGGCFSRTQKTKTKNILTSISLELVLISCSKSMLETKPNQNEKKLLKGFRSLPMIPIQSSEC